MEKKQIEGTDIVVASEINEVSINAPAAAANFFGGTTFGLWTSLPLDNKIGIAQAMGDADYNLRDYFKVAGFANPIEMVDCLAHNVDIISDDGEAIKASRLVIIDKDGKTYSTVADGARSSLGNLFNIFGLPPFNPPLKIVAREVKTRRGFYTLNIVPVE